MRFNLVLPCLAALTSTACVSTFGLNSTAHPSRDGSVNAAGMAIGGIYATVAEEDSGSEDSLVQLPHGEGWARFALGGGQLGLRVTPALGYVDYRINVLSAQKSAVGLAVTPSLGAGYWSVSTGLDQGPSSSSQLALAPNLSLLFAFAGGDAYVIPRVGYLDVTAYRDGGGGSAEESVGLVSLGANAGFIVASKPFACSLELGFQRITSTEDSATGAVYLIVPTVGIQLD